MQIHILVNTLVNGFWTDSSLILQIQRAHCFRYFVYFSVLRTFYFRHLNISKMHNDSHSAYSVIFLFSSTRILASKTMQFSKDFPCPRRSQFFTVHVLRSLHIACFIPIRWKSSASVPASMNPECSNNSPFRFFPSCARKNRNIKRARR